MIKKYLSIFQPLNILFVIPTYFLGIGISNYLGFPLHWDILWDGLILVSAIHISSQYLGAYFERLLQIPSKTINAETSDQLDQEKNLSNLFLLTAIASLAVSLIPIMALVFKGRLGTLTLFLIVLAIGIIYIIELFPRQTANVGLLEFFRSLTFANLMPTIAFTLQSGSLHWLLFLLTFPLFFLFFCQIIILSLPTLEKSEANYQFTLAYKLGTVNALKAHNFLVLFAYLSLLSGAIVDLPWKLIWPALVTLPIALLQIWQVNQILRGQKPSFTPLIFTAMTTTGFTAYFMLLALWLN